MKKHFEYLMKLKPEADITIEDIGNCCLRAYNDLGFGYLLIIKTDSGNTQIIEYGPFVEDIDYLLTNVSYLYDRIQFSESKICNRINSFLLRNNISQVDDVELDEVIDKIKSMVDYL